MSTSDSGPADVGDAGGPLRPDARVEEDTNPVEALETVGAGDAAADAARSGADVDLAEAAQDSDGVPVGDADAQADAERTGADRDRR